MPEASCIACTKSSQVTACPSCARSRDPCRAKALGTEQRVLHSNDFGAFLVDGRRVEIVDLLILVGPHRVRHRSRVLGELLAPQIFDCGNPLDGARAHVARELLVAKDGEPFLQRELEPVAAGDAIARPVVEIFVADDAFDRAVIGVGGDLRVGEQQAAVEDVEALVLHAPMLKSSAQKIMNVSRSYSRPKRSSSQRIARFSDSIACVQRGGSAASNRSSTRSAVRTSS
jgi:hypothetical protein